MLKKDSTTERTIKRKVDIETKHAKKKFKVFHKKAWDRTLLYDYA